MTNTLSLKIRGLIQLSRPKQWIKNAFVFAPLIFAGQFMYFSAIKESIMAAFFFCIASSATYILNDINDIEHDRAHPTKSKTRPLASGSVSLSSAIILLVVLYAFLILGWFVLPKVLMAIAIYLIINVAYSFWLKDQPVIDIYIIAAGFVLRVYAGALALSVPVSSWMAITTLCLALYLASIKRKQELSLSGKQGRKVLEQYTLPLINRYAEMSGTGALMFYSMFVLSEKPQLVITIPVVLFGLFRYWYIVEKLDGGESPTDVLYKDWQLIVTILVWIVLCVFSLKVI